MHSRIVAAVATILIASLAYSQTGTLSTGTTSSSQLRSYTKAPTAKTRINRKDFGLHWNAALETGGVLVGDDVQITIDVELTRKAE